MRTTVTLDPDTAAIVERSMRERNIGFKQAINDAIRAGVSASSAGTTFRTKTYDMGMPMVNLDRALQLAADLEDDEAIRKMRDSR
ncbi:MAG: hypothetical protein KDA95_04320 [Acidimicrobiales bacterium]|nr:hypothetical protein [Acidimicrobiales bacterium]